MCYNPPCYKITKKIIRDTINMTNNIVFLDIDGVLNVYPYNEYYYLCHQKVRLLNSLAKDTNCRFVISSMWKRCFSLKEIKNRLVNNGLVSPSLIVGQTPDLGGYHPPREQEIYKWLYETHGINWCVLDDKVLPKISKERFFQTDFWKDGLKESTVQDITKFFNKN